MRISRKDRAVAKGFGMKEKPDLPDSARLSTYAEDHGLARGAPLLVEVVGRRDLPKWRKDSPKERGQL